MHNKMHTLGRGSSNMKCMTDVHIDFFFPFFFLVSAPVFFLFAFYSDYVLLYSTSTGDILIYLLHLTET